MPIEVVSNGSKREYVYDYRGRRINTKTHLDATTSHESKLVFKDNQLFSSEDRFGRMTYYAYDATDGRMIRSVNGLVPEFSLVDFAAVINQVRDSAANAIYTVTDNVYGPTGNLLRSHDPRNICLLYTSPSPRDQRGSRMPSSA